MRTTTSPLRAVSLAAICLLMADTARAQGPPESPVRYTVAREHSVRRMIQLPGSVDAHTTSLVASEVPGLVSEMLAREGDTVRKGQPLARLSVSTLEARLKSAQAQLREAASRRKLAQLTLERARGLFESKVVSQQDLDSSQSEFEAWQGRVDTLDAEIARLTLDMEHSTIRAPFGGTVVAEHAEAGEWVAMGGPVVELISLQDLDIRVEVPERYFSSLNPGATATVTFDSLPGLRIEGRVSAVVPRADPQARTFPIKVRVANREGRIGSGMLAQISFQAGEAYTATVVPKDAVVTQGNEKFVYLIKDDRTVDLMPVQPREGIGAWIVVEGKIVAGQKVVTRGNERLHPGATVTAEPLEYALP